jgi:hypothetical protein
VSLVIDQHQCADDTITQSRKMRIAASSTPSALRSDAGDIAVMRCMLQMFSEASGEMDVCHDAVEIRQGGHQT